tara:strand:+ start:280 stop:549 length:270 start_codon:yes stop_codon:yes gene_type:complete
MAAKGQAAKSASGASMSKYDVEVEGRLQALESAIAELKKEIASHKHPAPAAKSGGDGGRVDALVDVLNSIPDITQHCQKGPDGVRRIDI